MRFIKYGKRAIDRDGQSQYFEVSIEVHPDEFPEEAAHRAREFVSKQLELGRRAEMGETTRDVMTASIGERIAAQGPKASC